MADIVNHHKGCCEIHLIDDPVLSDPESIEPFSALQLGGLRWKWIGLLAIYATKERGIDCGSFSTAGLKLRLYEATFLKPLSHLVGTHGFLRSSLRHHRKIVQVFHQT